jgi:hypothetical protein
MDEGETDGRYWFQELTKREEVSRTTKQVLKTVEAKVPLIRKHIKNQQQQW